MYSTNYNTIDKQEHRIPQGGTRPLVVEPQLHFTQPSVSNQMNTVRPHVVDTTLPPLLLTKREKEDFETHTMGNTKAPQKDEELLKVVQTFTQSLQKQIVLGMYTADMSQQRTDALIGELIKSHNRRNMGDVLNNIPIFNVL